MRVIKIVNYYYYYCSPNAPEISKVFTSQALKTGVSSKAEMGPYYAQISPVTSSCSSEGSSSSSKVTERKSILLDDQGIQLGLTVVRDRDISSLTEARKGLKSDQLASIDSNELSGTESQNLVEGSLEEESTKGITSVNYLLILIREICFVHVEIHVVVLFNSYLITKHSPSYCHCHYHCY